MVNSKKRHQRAWTWKSPAHRAIYLYEYNRHNRKHPYTRNTGQRISLHLDDDIAAALAEEQQSDSLKKRNVLNHFNAAVESLNGVIDEHRAALNSLSSQADPDSKGVGSLVDQARSVYEEIEQTLVEAQSSINLNK